jgi:serine-type D-Ala-D-Ala carboxypeptidase/endopeptidase (penicillin-binding protein 4)
MRGRLPAAVFSILVLLACFGTPAPLTSSVASGQQPDPEPLATLQRRIAELVEDASVSAGTWGVAVRSLQTQETLAAVNAARLLTPASTMKLVTLAVAADRLGWDYTFETRVMANGLVANGTLSGDLIVIGSGDPSLDDWDGAGTALFRTWADRLRTLGIDTIDGRIIGDDDAFGDEGAGAGWAWDDLAFSYSAVASALQFNQNSAQLRIAPGPAVGTPAVVTLTPPYADVPMRALVMTDAPGTPASITIGPGVRAGSIDVGGVVPFRTDVVARNVAVTNPTLYFARAVREGLRGAGIAVRGEAVDVDDLDERPSVERAVTVMIHRSPTLASLAETMMKLSQNLYAETLLRSLAMAQSGVGTAEEGRTVVRDVLGSWGIDPAEVLIADGSGLSRYNLVTPRALVALLAHVHADARLRDDYIASLPVAGRTGTLAQRLKGTRAEGAVQAKTGSFSNARAIAGFTRTADGEPVAFAIVANNYGGPAAAVDRISDAIVTSIRELRRTGAR